MRVPGEHRLDPMASDVGQVGVVDADCAEMSDVAVAALMWATVQVGGFLGRLPDVPVEIPLPPHSTPGRREDQFAVGTVHIDLGFEHPGQGRGDRPYTAGAILAVVGLGAFE